MLSQEGVEDQSPTVDCGSTHFRHMRSRQDLFPPEPKIEAFLTHLAVNKNVAPATQNQAMNPLVFLYIRADKKVNIPVVLTRIES